MSGGTNPATNFFLTFLKARMECSVKGEPQTIPFYYNDLSSTFLDQSDSKNPALYRVFNSPVNGPAGAAICKFSFDATESGSITEVLTFWCKGVPIPFSCPGSSGNQRDAADVENFNIHTRTTNIFISSFEFLDEIVAETIEYMGDVQELIYFTSRQGSISSSIRS